MRRILPTCLALQLFGLAPAFAASIELTPAEAQKALGFLARADIKGAEAPDLMALAAKLNAVASLPTPPPPPKP